MDCKNICIIASVHQSPFNIRVFHKEAKSLLAAGYRITMIVQHDRDEIRDGIKIVALGKPKNRFHRFTVHALNAFRIALRQKSLIYHIQSPELLPMAVALKLLTGRKVVYDVHEDFPKDFLTKEWLPACTRSLVSGLFRYLERISCFFIDLIITATGAIARNFPAHKTVTVTNYPFRELASSPVLRSISRKSQYTLIYAGDLSEERGIRELVGAIGMIKDFNVRLRLIGRFTNPDFRAAVKALPTYGVVDYSEWMPFPDIIDNYRRADIGLIVYLPRPNHIEAMPNKLFEYMALELPVIASNFPLWKKIIEGNQCGINVDPCDPRDIARAIITLLMDGGERIRMGRRGREAVNERYNWEFEKNTLLRAYKKLTV